MRFRTIATVLAVTAGLIVTTGNAANAATVHRPNVLHGFCSAHRDHDCVDTADNDEGVLIVRDHAGHRINLGHDTHRITAYLNAHANPCRHGAYRCIGGPSDNRTLFIGGSAHHPGALYYVADFGS